MNVARWLYRGGRPNRFASVINRWTAAVYALGIAPNYLVTLDVVGRRSGRVQSLPLVMAVAEGERYLVSMLGEEVAWVRNVRAAGGNVTLRHGRREEVRVEVAPERRAPVLKAYLKRAPGARPHLPIHKDAPLSEFAQVSNRFPYSVWCRRTPRYERTSKPASDTRVGRKPGRQYSNSGCERLEHPHRKF
jgi:hypothetical protein